MTITLNYDDPDEEFYACSCGIVSRLAEELKYRVQDENGNESIITSLETMEFDYWNEANSFEFWTDCVDIDPEEMTTEEIKQSILDNLPALTPKMSYDEEREMVSSI